MQPPQREEKYLDPKVSAAAVQDRRYVDLFDMTGRIAIVTGGARGLGRGIVERLLDCGATVAIADANPAVGQAAADELGNKWEGPVRFDAIDVTDDEAVAAYVSTIADTFGKIDILVNNAGIYPSSLLLKMPTAQLDAVLDLDLRAPFILCREVGKAMVERQVDGRMLNVSSMNAFVPRMAGVSHYDAAKAGLLALTRSLAIELGRHGIRVNAIAPGLNLTEGQREAFGMNPGDTEAAYPRFFQEWLHRMPLRRVGGADDQARVAVFLLSDAAAYVTGQCLIVDGGASLV
jgi:NAD(P)-dependent dehydrogenase (short-subunit alcohol dehydrogenase family)